MPYPAADPVSKVDFQASHFAVSADQPEQPLSSFEILQQLKPGEFLEITKNLNEVLSRGFEQGYYLSSSCSSERERADAKLTSELLARITPDGLSNIYRIAGKLLYDWIDRCKSK
jgi:hypothetical protein